MKSDRLVIGAVVFLCGGIGLLFGFTDGTTGFNIGYPFSATRLHVDITTTGIPVLAGLPMVAAGVLLLFFALIAAIAAQFQRSEPFQTLHLPSDVPSKRQGPFEE